MTKQSRMNERTNERASEPYARDGPNKMQKRGVKSTVTDIELDTLRYACETFEWSDAALRWIQNEIAAESAGPERSGVSYYQVIDGVRYDRKVRGGQAGSVPVVFTRAAHIRCICAS